MIVKVKGGELVATKTFDPEYPGIDIEFISDSDKGSSALSRPRVLFECTKEGKLRVLVWADEDNEDYTPKVEFDIKAVK